jgi:hypothetical protein
MVGGSGGGNQLKLTHMHLWLQGISGNNASPPVSNKLNELKHANRSTNPSA